MSEKNVRIKNLLPQSIKISLQRGQMKAVEVTLQPREALPNERHPDEISETELTSYTKGLAASRYIRITPVANAVAA